MEIKKYLVVECRNCGKLTPASSFCKNCGALDNRLTAEFEAITCPFCKKTVAKGEYCGCCGKKMQPE